MTGHLSVSCNLAPFLPTTPVMSKEKEKTSPKELEVEVQALVTCANVVSFAFEYVPSKCRGIRSVVIDLPGRDTERFSCPDPICAPVSSEYTVAVKDFNFVEM